MAKCPCGSQVVPLGGPTGVLAHLIAFHPTSPEARQVMQELVSHQELGVFVSTLLDRKQLVSDAHSAAAEQWIRCNRPDWLQEKPERTPALLPQGG